MKLTLFLLVIFVCILTDARTPKKKISDDITDRIHKSILKAKHHKYPKSLAGKGIKSP